ncbi:interleukin-12 receptor subunit beta-2-like isoform X2 [Heterodontus francisci]|uniref:interleukin-12 receptor subunit beta-2-like isoform X2 n=1 Tax=Heterodontus francisci TaxID=7792 RepID=UPI00355BDB00
MQVIHRIMRIVYEVLLFAAVLIQQGKQTDPLDPPQDLFCFRLDKNSAVNCTWSPSDFSQIPTNYSFYYREKGSNDLLQKSTNVASLMLERKLLHAGITYIAWVTANTSKGKESLAPLEFIIEDIVKPLPPVAVTGEPAQDDPKAIQISWTKPTNFDSASLQFELQYRVAGDLDWTEISHDEIGIDATEYELEDLQTFTLYEFRIQCGRQEETNRRLWSEWSAVSSVRTSEDSPVGCLNVWFVRQLPDVEGRRSLTVLWKPLEQRQARGIIKSYSVSHGDEGKMEMKTSSCCNISLPGTTKLVTVTAHNSVGATQPAKLNLVQAVLYPRIPYNVSVYAQYQGGLGGPVSTLVYTEEGVPLAGPEISIFSIYQTGVTLLWKVLPLDQRQGFVLYCTLYYVKNPGGDTKYKALNVSCELNGFTLSDLEPESTYKIWMTASTIVGEGSRGPYLNFNTQASQIVAWKILVLVFGSIVIVVLCILFCRCYSRQRIQSFSSFYLPQWCCQKIPDPGNSRVGHQQHHYAPDHPGMIEEPEVVEVEEIETEDEVQVSLTNSNNPTLAGERGPNTDNLYWTNLLSQNVDNSPKAPRCLDKRLVDQPISTKLIGGALFTSGYERHFMPSEKDLLDNEWHLNDKEQWLGMGDTTGDF